MRTLIWNAQILFTSYMVGWRMLEMYFSKIWKVRKLIIKWSFILTLLDGFLYRVCFLHPQNPCDISDFSRLVSEVYNTLTIYPAEWVWNPTHKRSVLCMTLNYVWWWGSCFGNLVSVEYVFISTTPGSTLIQNSWGCPRGIMIKALDCGTVVSEFELQSRYYVHFRTNTLEIGMNPLILPAMG